MTSPGNRQELYTESDTRAHNPFAKKNSNYTVHMDSEFLVIL